MNVRQFLLMALCLFFCAVTAPYAVAKDAFPKGDSDQSGGATGPRKFSIFAVSTVEGLGSHLGNVGVSGLVRIFQNVELEIGGGLSILNTSLRPQFCVATQLWHLWPVNSRKRYLEYIGYSLSLERVSRASQEYNPFYGHTRSLPIYDETGTYKTHWIHAGWGMEFDILLNARSTTSLSFVVGGAVGGRETTAGGEVTESNGVSTRKKTGPVWNAFALTLVPLRIKYQWH